jgi:Flp pilus assembly protein TadD
MSHALQHTDQLTPKDQKDLYNDLGYLLADENEYERAAEVWSKSVELEPDPVIMLRMARMYRLGGNLPRAEDVLAQIDPNKLPPRMQAEQLDELAAIKGSQGQLEEAIATLSKANALEPAASRYHQAGMMYSRLDRNRAAIEYLEKARSLDPKNNEYAIALAYAYKNARRFRDAAALFEEAVKHDPDNAALYRELGYVEMRDNNNERAGAWLKKAIDAELANTPGSLSSKLKVEVYGMRRDLGRLTQTYDVTAYLTYRSSSLAQGSIPSFLAGGVLPSQGGLEFSYQPPRFGFRDERIFQFFGRLLWNIQPDSLEFDTKSYQGGIGFRYKPARSQNLYLSGERIFKIGSLAEDHWLLRTSYSWDYGYDLKPDRPMWNYTFLYGDTGFFADKPRALVYFVEGRQGITWRLGDSFLITPHFIIDARYQNPRALNASYWEGGLGVSIRYLFNETRYEAPRSSSELLIHYKNGLFFGNPRSLDTSFSGLVITGAFHF